MSPGAVLLILLFNRIRKHFENDNRKIFNLYYNESFLMYHSAKSELSAVTVITIVTSTGNQFQKLTGQMLMFGSMVNLLFQILHFQQILIFYP